MVLIVQHPGLSCGARSPSLFTVDPDFGKASALVASSFLPLLLGQGLNYLVVRALLTLAKRIHRRLPVARPGAQ